MMIQGNAKELVLEINMLMMYLRPVLGLLDVLLPNFQTLSTRNVLMFATMGLMAIKENVLMIALLMTMMSMQVKMAISV